MHILIIHQIFVGPDEVGGTRHYEFARHFVQRGDQCTIVASNLTYLTGRASTTKRGLVTDQNIEGIRVLRAYTYPSLHKNFVWRVFSFLSFMFTSIIAGMRASKVDVVMGTSPPIFQAVSAWIVSVLRRRPFLLEVRDLWPEFAVDMGVLNNKMLIWLARQLESFLYARSDHILVNSPAYVTYLQNKGVLARKITLIPNGVDPDMFDPDADGKAIRREYALGDKFVITYTGALGMANDIDTILRAAVRLQDTPDIHFLIVGDGKERPHLEQSIRERHLTNVTMPGALPKSRMKELLAASDAGIAILKDIPMFRTTYPNKVFDYMAAGRPTVLVIDGVIRQVIEDAHGGCFVPPGDDLTLAETARWLADHREEARMMGQSARTYVVEHFNRSVHSQMLVELVQRMTGQV